MTEENKIEANANYGKPYLGGSWPEDSAETDAISAYPLELTLFRDITRITAWLDEKSGLRNNPVADNLSRVLKIGEEYGESVQAIIGLTGQNPRKGVTHSRSDLLAELADVIVTAFCAIQHFTQDETVT